MNKKIHNSFHKLLEFVQKENFQGWDPYDGLNSYIVKYTPLKYSYIFRLLFIQLFKRNKYNFRRIAGIQKEENPKGLGLFITSFSNLFKTNPKEVYYKNVINLANRVIELKSIGFSGDCWGYNFDWQSRAFFLPKYTPTIVATAFVSNSLIDAFEVTNDQKYLDSAVSSSNFIVKDLNRTKKKKGFIFSYSPIDYTRVYNASLLGSKLLARIYSYTNENIIKDLAYDSVVACTDAQNCDGSWIYGELPIQNWIDSFHTGYNLECINDYQIFTGIKEFDNNLDRGFNYYINNFFLENGIPKYYNNKIYPIDIHSAAQFIVTISKLKEMNKDQQLADKVLNWVIENMQNKEQGYFYYQKKKYFTIEIPYMRWTQSWMLYAFSYYFKNGMKNEE